jgi:hypothetical protein
MQILDSFPDDGWKTLGEGRYERVEVRTFVSPWPLSGLVFATEFEHEYSFTPRRNAPAFDNVPERSAALVSARLRDHAGDIVNIPLFAKSEPYRLGEQVWLVSWGAIKTFCIELIGTLCCLGALLPGIQAFGKIRSHRRIAEGRCGWCGYPQTQPATVCSECGRSTAGR